MSQRSVADLKPGEKAIIRTFSDQWMSLKLLEMGCLPALQSPDGRPHLSQRGRLLPLDAESRGCNDFVD
jgi:hypothetical protein